MFEIKECNIEILKELEIDTYFNQTVFLSYEWVKFLEKNIGKKPIILSINKDKKVVGYFIGIVFKKFGIKILGSPFEGWATCDMGFCANEDINKIDLLESIKDYALNQLGCMYMEVVDYDITFSDLDVAKYSYINHKTYMLNIKRSDEELFKIFKTDCRNYIRQFERRGATISKVEPTIEFANEYYEQLIEVFAKQNLKPNYDRQKVIDLIESFKDNPENILCLKVSRPDGKCIATSIFLGLKKRCYFWGAASYREDQHYRPNEYMIWYAIKYWRNKNIEWFDMVGLRDYKKKFGPDIYEYPRIIFTKYKMLLTARNLAKKLIKNMRKLKGA